MNADAAELSLRSPEQADIDLLAHYCNEWELARMTARMPFPYTRADAVEAVTNLANSNHRVQVICANGALIGMVGHDAPVAENQAAGQIVGQAVGVVRDFGYWIGKPFWRRGFGKRAARLALSRIFTDPAAQEVRACVFQENPASARILESCAFSYLGDCTGESRARGPGQWPLWLYSLSRTDWEAAHEIPR